MEQVSAFGGGSEVMNVRPYVRLLLVAFPIWRCRRGLKTLAQTVPRGRFPEWHYSRRTTARPNAKSGLTCHHNFYGLPLADGSISGLAQPFWVNSYHGGSS